MKSPGRILLGMLAVLICAAPAPAQPKHYLDQDTSPSFGGNATHLPVGPGTDLAEAIDHARHMLVVQRGVDECLRRGYVRAASRDTGLVLQNPSTTLVILAFEKPGLTNPDGLIGAPVVQVATGIDDFGNLRTQVSGGLIFADRRDGSLHPAEEVPGFALDGTFDVTPSGISGKLQPYRIVKCFNSYLFCAGWGNTGCVALALMPPGPWSIPRSLVCVGFNTVKCIHGFSDCWSND